MQVGKALVVKCKSLDNSYFSSKLRRASYGWNSRYTINRRL
jgi:hypothetical protein